VDEGTLGELMRSLLARRGEDVQRITREIGGRQALAATAAMFTIAVEREFGEGATPAEVSEFVSDACARYPKAHRVNRTVAEALVRSALGEEGVLDGLDLTEIGTVEAFLAAAIVDAKQYSPEEMDGFIAQAEAFAREGLAYLQASEGEARG